ncbi:MAG: glycosyltransferase family 2 protein [Caldilineaceae bacterium]|nr:glycosyltransferase family 2 protein [Caldilineaceae bacterium]
MSESKPKAPSLTIGMPVYNGERFVARALASLIAQDFGDWILIVADNCSTDGTCAAVEAFCRQDARIRLVRHEMNRGAVGNFLYLAEQANTPYFMWAAHDDEWSGNYIGACLAQLNAHPDVGFASGMVVNIDAEGRHVRVYNSFISFGAKNAERRLRSYLVAREADGKANMIYSVYRTQIVRAVCSIPGILDGWGADMAFVAAALARVRYLPAEDATLLKRITSESDLRTARALANRRYGEVEYRGYCSLSLHNAYTCHICGSMPDRATSVIVKRTMRRLQLMLFIRERLTRIFSLSLRAINRFGRPF